MALGHLQPDYLPTRRGFDTQYGHYNGALDYFTHDRDGGHDWHRNDQECRDEGYTNLTEDPYEQNNLAAQNPELVRQLRARLEAYRAAAVPPKAENQPANHKAPRVWGQ